MILNNIKVFGEQHPIVNVIRVDTANFMFYT